MKKQQKEDLIWASGRYLTTYLPDDFDTWSEKKLHAFLEKYASENVEYWDAEDIWEEISDLANSVRRYVS
jgi:hypothetical protein